MNKKANTILFLIGGTIYNIIITIVCFFFLWIIFSTYLYPMLPESISNWIWPIIFVAPIVASFFVYKLTLDFIMKKVDMNKYFDPIFSRRQPPGKS